MRMNQLLFSFSPAITRLRGLVAPAPGLVCAIFPQSESAYRCWASVRNNNDSRFCSTAMMVLSLSTKYESFRMDVGIVSRAAHESIWESDKLSLPRQCPRRSTCGRSLWRFSKTTHRHLSNRRIARRHPTAQRGGWHAETGACRCTSNGISNQLRDPREKMQKIQLENGMSFGEGGEGFKNRKTNRQITLC
jgi:hypothetical protein